METHEIAEQIHESAEPHAHAAPDRDRFRQRRGMFLGLALAFTALAFGVRLGTGALTCLLAIDYVWNAWHFASQHHGIYRVYDRLAGTVPAAGMAAVTALPSRLRSATASTSMYWADPDAWIDRMRGTDRLVFHAHQHLLPAIVGARNVLANAREAWAVPEADNSIAIATHGPAISGLFGDDVWERYTRV